jgi:hypothetical protein
MANEQEIQRYLELLHKPGDLLELRTVNPPQSYYFTNMELAAIFGAILEGKKNGGVYAVINPIDPAILRNGKFFRLHLNPTDVQDDSFPATRKPDILRYDYWFLDFDNIKKTAEGKAECLQVLKRVVRVLKTRHGIWPYMICDSGRGWHVFFKLVGLERLDQPLLHRASTILNREFGCECTPEEQATCPHLVRIDRACTDPQRITRLYGTTNRKDGSATSVVRVLQGEPVTKAKVSEIAGPEGEKRTYADNPDITQEKLEEYLSLFPETKDFEGPFDDVDDQGNPRWRYQIADCLWSNEHSMDGGDLAVYLWPSGKRGLHCFHDHCSGRGWREFREQLAEWHPDADFYWPESEWDTTQFGNDIESLEEAMVSPAPKSFLDCSPNAEPVCDLCHRTKAAGCVCGAFAGGTAADELHKPKHEPEAPLLHSRVEAMLAEEETGEEAEVAEEPVAAVRTTRRTTEEVMQFLSPEARKQALVEEWGLTVIPGDALYGWLGVVAKQLDLPLSIAYPAVLTAYSAVMKDDEILDVQCNLYTALMMGVGGGKNIALTRSARALNLRYELDYMDATIGGAGGLFQALGNKSEGRGKDKVDIPGPRKMLINPAEFAATLANMKLENSTLATHLCNLWDKRQISLPVREGKREINCRLSILGALPVDAEAPETFTRYFGEETGAGLYSRFLFGFTKERLDHRWAERWKWDPPMGQDYIDDLVPTCPPEGWSREAEDYYSGLALYGDTDGRGLFNLKRIALLLSTANRDKSVTLDAVKSAELFMLWQAQLKRHFKHGEAQQLRGGELSTVILDTFRRIDAEGKYERSPVIDGRLCISVPRVIHKNHWEKYGVDVVMRMIDALVKAGQLTYGKKYRVGKPGVEERGVGKPGVEERVAVPSKMHVVVVRF